MKQSWRESHQRTAQKSCFGVLIFPFQNHQATIFQPPDPRMLAGEKYEGNHEDKSV